MRSRFPIRLRHSDSLLGWEWLHGVEIFSRFFQDLEAYWEADGSPDAARWTPDLLAASAEQGLTR